MNELEQPVKSRASEQAGRDGSDDARSALHNEAYSSDASRISLTRSTVLSSDAKAAGADLLPNSVSGRAMVLLEESSKAVVPAVKEAWFGTHDVHVPLSKSVFGKDVTVPVPKIAETAAIGAAIGFAADTLLPSTGTYGKVGGAFLAGVLAAPALSEGYNIYSNISNAQTMTDLRQAGRELGTAIGSLAANVPVGIAGYEAGVYAGDRFLVSQARRTLVDAGINFPFSNEVLKGLAKGPGGIDIWLKMSKLPLD